MEECENSDASAGETVGLWRTPRIEEDDRVVEVQLDVLGVINEVELAAQILPCNDDMREADNGGGLSQTELGVDVDLE